ncbi:HNH endonuclease signature motif containing protein, partial [Mycobacterium kiyosense]
VIRWSGAAHPYLALFDGATPLALYHTKRLANRAQRLMLYARDRGCTRPGCTTPAYHCQVHHLTAWQTCHSTHITNLALACGIHNRLADKGWTTHTTSRGHTQWLPPTHLDHGQPRINTFHHPERRYPPNEDDDVP